MTQTSTPAPLTPTPQNRQLQTTPRKVQGVLSRLTVPQKLALVSAPLLLGLSISLTFNINDQWQEIFKDRRALTGTQYLVTAKDIYSSIQQNRRLVVPYLAGNNGAKAQMLEEQGQIDGLFQQLNTLTTTHPISEELNKVIQATQVKWDKFSAQIENREMSSQEGFENIENFLLSDIGNLINTIALESDMNNLQYRRTAELVSLTSKTIPRNWAESGKIRTSTNIALQSKEALSESQLSSFREQLTTATIAHQTIIQQAELALRYAPSNQEAMRAAIDEMDKKMTIVIDNFRKIVDSGSVPENKQALFDTLAPSLESQVNFYDVSLETLRQAISFEERALFLQAILTLIAAVFFFGVATWLSLATARGITRSLSTLTNAAQSLSQGNFNTRAPITTSDEIATLTETFNIAAAQLEENQLRVEEERLEQQRLQNNIGQFLDVTMDISEGDLTKRGVVTEDILGNVVDSINLMTEELGYVLGDVQKASSSVTSGSQQMLSSTQDIRQGTAQTTQVALSVAEQTAEVNRQIQEMARIAQASADAARQTLQASSEGQQAVQNTLSDMQNIRETTRTAEERIASLAERSKQIGQIVDAISNIASQTNLLSLHASIEAAGAGEAGERFSVVADEVRQLADESAQATRQITGLITSLQNDINETVRIIRESAQQVNQGYEVAGTAGQRLEQIGDLSRESARLAEQISLSSREQVQNIEQVASSVQDIAHTAERSQQSVEQGRAAAEQLQKLAENLNASLARFRLPN